MLWSQTQHDSVHISFFPHELNAPQGIKSILCPPFTVCYILSNAACCLADHLQGSVLCAKFCPDSPYSLAVGGEKNGFHVINVSNLPQGIIVLRAVCMQ